ncbi:LysM peptidoglycan-binding domain-containing protein [Isoptericola variabilis]|uniref:Peptidoglycan-binding lysin domain protein n=1 Tax=Isoptericola variabilis (strain 225) TaxID=743718 RepID=F6FRK7_ISOV2|nr:peptidoglycan-binding lysin domain protein [Isoptericola variabilis]AEG45065.1 Peptidoglycan-binding lysin domain protein [Isoptericola variabilis 225]TWH26192.1 hypothetical protein L600_000700000710 [Isoptericola variabilis J7]
MSSTDGHAAGDGQAGSSVVALVALAASAAAAAGVLGLRLAALVLASPSTAAVDRWVELGVTALGALAAAWLAASAVLALVCVGAARLGRSWRAGEATLRRVAPGAVQRLARAAVGVGVGTGLVLVPAAAHAATPAAASDPSPAPSAAAVEVTTDMATDATTELDLGWQPTPSTVADTTATVERTSAFPTTTERPTADPPARPHVGADAGTVVVHRGDTLWDLARAALGDDATDADVMRAVVRWHEANRDVIGDDPDLILPGQVLRAPA